MRSDLPQLHHDVVFGKADGRIIWQPRIGCWFFDKLFAGEELPPFKDLEMAAIYSELKRKSPMARVTECPLRLLAAVYRELECSQRIYFYNSSFKKIEHPSVRFTQRQLNETDVETVIETPVGKQTYAVRTLSSSYVPMYLKREITTEEDMKIATWRVENTTWAWDQDAFDQVHADWGDLGAPTMYLPRVTVQDLYINTMGTEAGIYAVMDWPDTIGAYFRALDDCHDRLIDVINASPIMIINFGDNLHGGTLPPEWFQKYVLPSYQRRCERLHRAGKFVHSHWDGDTKMLLPMAKETGLDGIEAITPKPQGDVTLEEVKEGLGDELFLIDGIPAVYFDEIFPLSVLETCCHRIIELFAPRLVLGISDEISSTGNIERIRTIGHIVDAYNDSVETKNKRH